MTATASTFLALGWRQISLRHWRRAPWTHAVMLLIVALGVGSFFAVRLAGRSAAAGFELFADTLTGGSDLMVEAPVGPIPETWLPGLREALGPEPVKALPVLETTAAVPGGEAADGNFDAPTLTLLGVDLLAVRNLVEYRGPDAAPAEAIETGREGLGLGDPRQVYASAEAAERFGWRGGEQVRLIIHDRPHDVRVFAVLPEGGVGGAYLVMDLPALQSVANRPGELDRIELIVPETLRNANQPDALAKRLNAASDGRWIVTVPETERAAAETMTLAFRFNLSILSGLALLVGLFLVLQALEANVIRRRPEIGVLRMLGVERSWLMRLWMVESLTLGVIGSGLGLLLGWLGAQLTVRGVAGTVRSFYHATAVDAASWHTGEALLAGGIGVLACLLTGWLPARDAAETPPAHAFRRGPVRGGIRLLDHPRLGAVLVLAGWGLSALPPMAVGLDARLPVAGYLAALCFLCGGGILAAAALPALAVLLRGAGRRIPAAGIARSHFRFPSGRHKLTVAGLVLAVGMASGMMILIQSFQTTMWGWIDRTLSADVFIVPKGEPSASGKQRIQEATWRALAADPAMASAELRHGFPVRVEGADTYLVGRTRLPGDAGFPGPVWIEQPRSATDLSRPLPDGAWPAVASESFTRRFGRGVGDRVPVRVPSGTVTMELVGIFADYGNERGSLEAAGEAVTAWFGDRSAITCSLVLREGEAADRVIARLRDAWPGLAIRSQDGLREEIRRLFRDTFAITLALQAIGVVVAVGGLALAMVSLMLERRNELASLRELGMTRRGIAASAAWEGGLTAAVGLAGGLALGFVLGGLLIYVINRQSFGWTLSYAVAWDRLALLGAAILAVGAAASWRVGAWGAGLKGEREA